MIIIIIISSSTDTEKKFCQKNSWQFTSGNWPNLELLQNHGPVK